MRLLLSKFKNVMPAKAGIRASIQKLCKWIFDQTPAFAGVTALVLLCATPAFDEGYVYSPEGCEFEITFPEEPSTVRRCHEVNTDKCTLMNAYTKVFDMNAVVNVYVSCMVNEESFGETFSPDTMRTSLLARPGVSRLEVYDISHETTDLADSAALIGAGPSPNGNDVMIYVAQIWVGDKSLFTLEGELIGHDVEEADYLFADILKTLHHKDEVIPPAPADDGEEPEEQERPDTQQEKPDEDSPEEAVSGTENGEENTEKDDAGNLDNSNTKE